MNKDEALRLAIKALKTIDEAMPFPVAKLAIKECKAALEAKGEIDWKDMYEKQKRHTEMWVAKYEKDIGPLEKAVPQQEAKDEPEYYGLIKDHLWMSISKEHYDRLKPEVRMACYTTPPQRTWVGLTSEEKIIMSCYDLEYAALIGEVERKLKEKNYD